MEVVEKLLNKVIVSIIVVIVIFGEEGNLGFRSKLGVRNYYGSMCDCCFFEGGLMSYIDYYRGLLNCS